MPNFKQNDLVSIRVSCYIIALLYLLFNKNIKFYALNVVSILLAAPKIVTHIDIFQGIVSKLEIPVL